jgi:hypothetical protein
MDIQAFLSSRVGGQPGQKLAIRLKKNRSIKKFWSLKASSQVL